VPENEARQEARLSTWWRIAALAAIGVAGARAAPGQTAGGSRFFPELAGRPAVRDALARVDAGFAAQVDEWVRLTAMPAPSGHEAGRAQYVRERLEALALVIETDSMGNLWTVLRGSGGGPRTVIAAHLDTVHPEGTDLTVHRADSTLRAPGVFDNTASVANLLAVARAWRGVGVRTRGDVVLLWTVQEEVGLRGMAYWLDRHPADLLVALDGELGPVRYGALGIYWSRMRFMGAGSHTNTSRGKPHPARAAARCILDIYRIPLPAADGPVPAVYNVGMVGGGHVVNAIPEEVSFTVDLRTTDPALLERLDSTIVGTCATAAAAESVAFRRDWVQRSAAGGTPDQLGERRDHYLVATAIDVLRHVGWSFGSGPEAEATGSTDANVGVVRGIPAISIGRGVGGAQHTLREWADVPSARTATRQVLLLAVALAGLDER
jgi:acetylornithine deacetylase/succinyl-diaminopimelate desuccinylase-like protein